MICYIITGQIFSEHALKWSFTHKQHAWGLTQNYIQNLEKWPLKFKIPNPKTSFAQIKNQNGPKNASFPPINTTSTL